MESNLVQYDMGIRCQKAESKSTVSKSASIDLRLFKDEILLPPPTSE